jgi:hypothetical protein
LDITGQDDPGVIRRETAPCYFVRNAAKERVGGGMKNILLKLPDELWGQISATTSSRSGRSALAA